MSVNAIKTNERKSHQASYLKSAALGGLSGYALKYILPVNLQEKQKSFALFSDELNKQIREAKSREIQAIRNSQPRTMATDVFIGMVDKNKLTPSRINKLKEPLANDVFDIVVKINDKGREAKTYANEVLTAVTKHIRPTKTFVAIGAGVALSIAFVYNTLGKLSE